MALQDRTGQKVPSVVFRTRVGDTWKDVSTDDLFKGKKVVVFSLPGAFTPTCSSSHLPRYNELFGAFKENGVDAIYCVSVNDTFVMNAWAAEEEADNIYMIPDGNGEFTEGMGMLVGKEDLGFLTGKLKSLLPSSPNLAANSALKLKKLCKTKVCLTKKSYWAKMQLLLPFAPSPAR